MVSAELIGDGSSESTQIPSGIAEFAVGASALTYCHDAGKRSSFWKGKESWSYAFMNVSATPVERG